MLIPPLVNIFPGSSNKSKNSSENRFDHALGVHCHPLRFGTTGPDVLAPTCLSVEHRHCTTEGMWIPRDVANVLGM